MWPSCHMVPRDQRQMKRIHKWIDINEFCIRMNNGHIFPLTFIYYSFQNSFIHFTLFRFCIYAWLNMDVNNRMSITWRTWWDIVYIYILYRIISSTSVYCYILILKSSFGILTNFHNSLQIIKNHIANTKIICELIGLLHW